MSVWRQIARGLRGLVRRDAADRDAADEVQHYLEEAAAAHRSRGLPPAEAQRAAQLEIGNATVVREQLRGVGWENVVVTLVADLRFAWRLAARRPGFSVLVALTLAIGAGATTAIYSAVRPILFEPLPYPAPDRLVTVTERGRDGLPAGIGFATIKDIEASSRSFEALAAVGLWVPTLNGRAEPERVEGAKVSSTYFAVLGVRPFLGRDFRKEEDRPNAPRVAILSYGLWRGRFGGDSTVVGGPITVDGLPFTVAGVMPPGFENVIDPAVQIWEPLRYDVSLPYACRTCHHLQAIGRLKAGIRVAAATSELNLISARLVADHPTEYEAPGMLVPALKDQVIGGVRSALLVLFGAAGLVLLIACANVVNLLLVRGAQRRGEFVLRATLGAGRGRLLRQLLAEGLLLAVLGGVLGIAVAALAVRALVAAAPPALPRLADIRLDGPALAFTFAVTALAGLTFGLLPAGRATRGDLHPGLAESARRSTGGRHATRRALVVTEIALALTILVGTGLLARTMARLFAVPPGFNATDVLTMQVQTTGPRFTNDTVTHAFFARVLDTVRALPDVQSAGLTSQLPLSGDDDMVGVHLESKPSANPELDPSAFRYAVSSGYLETMQIPLLRGRLLAPTDRSDAPPVVVISDGLARRVWPREDPLGQRVRIGDASRGPWRTVVGVVGDVKQRALSSRTADAVYLPEVQWPYADGAMSLAVRLRAGAAPAAQAMRAAIWGVDKDQPILRVATMAQLASATEAERRFTLLLLAAFAAVALALAVTGIYGVLSNSVTERTREIGVRSALGATRADILALVVREGMVLTMVGVAIGLAGAVAASRAIAAMLFDTSRLDPLTYLGVILVLVGVSAAAAAVPAWRAARVDPSVTLRAE